MGAGSAGSSGSNDTQVSGNEAFYSKQKNSKINKGINVSTYGGTKINTKPTDNEKDDTEARIEVFKTKGATDIENKKFLGASNLLKGGLKIIGTFAKGKIKQSMNLVLDEFVNYAKLKSN